MKGPAVLLAAGDRQPHALRGETCMPLTAACCVLHGMCYVHAGGWVAGAALALEPSRFPAAVLTVPALDALGAALDEQYAWDELGNPCAHAHAYRSIKAWSPYDALLGPAGGGLLGGCMGQAGAIEDAGPPMRSDQHAARPCVMVREGEGEGFAGQPTARTAWPPANRLLLRVGLYDTIVNFWDPLKWLARRRLSACAEADTRARADSRDVADADGAATAGMCMVVRPGHHDAFEDVAGEAAKRAFQVACLIP